MGPKQSSLENKAGQLVGRKTYSINSIIGCKNIQTNNLSIKRDDIRWLLLFYFLFD
jgi:hypothetical protein